ncbi:MAG: hypothetical protein ACE5HT_14835 [Gemmatimonadales bacterium]
MGGNELTLQVITVVKCGNGTDYSGLMMYRATICDLAAGTYRLRVEYGSQYGDSAVTIKATRFDGEVQVM